MVLCLCLTDRGFLYFYGRNYRNFISCIKYYNEHSILNIFYIFAYYMRCLHFRTSKFPLKS